MEVIQIAHVKEIKEPSYIGYVCEPSVEAAAIQFEAKMKIKPEKAYYKTEASGKCSVYIPVRTKWLGRDIEND